MRKIIDHQLKNSDRDVQKKITSINDDWAKITIEVFISSSLLIDTETAVTMSSFFDVCLKEKKKNRRSNFVVFFFSNVLLLKETKKNRESNLVVFFSSNILLLTKKKKNRKSNLVVFFLSKIMFSVEKMKKWKIIFLNLSFD